MDKECGWVCEGCGSKWDCWKFCAKCGKHRPKEDKLEECLQNISKGWVVSLGSDEVEEIAEAFRAWMRRKIDMTIDAEAVRKEFKQALGL